MIDRNVIWWYLFSHSCLLFGLVCLFLIHMLTERGWKFRIKNSVLSESFDSAMLLTRCLLFIFLAIGSALIMVFVLGVLVHISLLALIPIVCLLIAATLWLYLIVMAIWKLKTQIRFHIQDLLGFILYAAFGLWIAMSCVYREDIYKFAIPWFLAGITSFVIYSLIRNKKLTWLIAIFFVGIFFWPAYWMVLVMELEGSGQLFTSVKNTSPEFGPESESRVH